MGRADPGGGDAQARGTPTATGIAIVTAPGRPGGTLYVVATPIGNLADVTLRSIEVLRSVHLVAAEDTRVTRRLLARHGISARLVSHHARNAAARQPELLAHLRGGLDLAVVTDAGTPGVSDPGESLVAAWAAEGGRIVPIPGASAVTAALAAAGIAGPRWAFEGFLPRAGRERRARLAAIAGEGRGAVLFEAPRRLAATLADLAAACGPDRPAAVCRELTKMHEEILRGSLGELAASAAAGAIETRGEATIVLGWWAATVGPATRGGVLSEGTPPGAEEPGGSDGPAHGLPHGEARERGRGAPAPALARALARVDALVAEGTPRGEAARSVAAETGIPRRLLYRPTTDQAATGH